MTRKAKTALKKVWCFIWNDDSICSWIVNIVLAFVLIKFIVYPLLGLILATSHPIVAVVSGSMEHKLVSPCTQIDQRGNCINFDPNGYEICGKKFTSKERVDFDFFWDTCGGWYVENNITKSDFEDMSFRNGFNTGDIMILYGTDPQDLKLGDIVVFRSSRPDPIIHRIVEKDIVDGKCYFKTKGDHNSASYQFESRISEDFYVGRAVVRIPFLGYVKIMAVRLLSLIVG